MIDDNEQEEDNLYLLRIGFREFLIGFQSVVM